MKVNNEYVSYRVGDKELRLPVSDCILLDIEVASAETLAEFVLKRLMEKVRFPANVKAIEIGVDEGRGQGAWTSANL